MTNKTTIEDLLEVFKNSNINFAFVVRAGDGDLLASHRELEPLRDFVRLSPAFAGHEAVFVGRAASFETLFFAFVHNTNRGLAQGGLRVMEYPNLAAVLHDGLRLSQGMSRKNAVADLRWGGGKGIIPLTRNLIEKTFRGDTAIQNRTERDALFAAYGEFVAKLNGVYYTAADIGTNNRDMLAILSANRFVTSLPPQVGGSGDPSPHTAEGVFLAIKTARRHLTGSDDLTHVSVAVQGAGKVGAPLVEKLLAAGAEVFVSETRFETDALARTSFREKFPSAQIVPCGAGSENGILTTEVEIIAPCAVGGTINQAVIPLIKPSVKIICGGANNILADEVRDGELLRRREIVFVPDFACNWMGIVNSANEAFGYLEEDVSRALEKLPAIVGAVLKRADDENISHTTAAHRIADEKIGEKPDDEFLRNRGRRIINRLIEKHGQPPDARHLSAGERRAAKRI